MYINVWDKKYREKDGIIYPFVAFVGGRGCGKTFSAIGGVLGLENPEDNNYFGLDHEEKFIYLRRTQNEMDIITSGNNSDDSANPFKGINYKFPECKLTFNNINKNQSGIYHYTLDENGIAKPRGRAVGYGFAVSTIRNIRGLSAPDIKYIIYDEFIPERNAPKMPGDEAEAFFNGYETINRNREFDGEDPVYVFFLANANDINNPLFRYLKVVNDCEKVNKKIERGESKLESLWYPDRGLAIHIMPADEDFVAKKKETALYKLTKGTQFYNMSLNNSFAYNDFTLTGYRDIKGYLPLCQIDDFYIYLRKDKSEIYCTYARCKCADKFKSKNKQDVICFNRRYLFINDYFAQSKITFESIEIKDKILDMLNI